MLAKLSGLVVHENNSTNHNGDHQPDHDKHHTVAAAALVCRVLRRRIARQDAGARILREAADRDAAVIQHESTCTP